jgi:5,10-methylenetetrahydromethanopterin reductase
MSAIASATSRIKFGSAVLNFYTRNPAAIASSFLALSDLGKSKPSNKTSQRSSSQRAVLGIGVGSAWNVAKYGITNRSGTISQLREAIESIRELFRGKQVTVRTDAFVIESVILSKASKTIPIHVGTSSPRGLEMAGEIADGLILTDRIPSDVEESMKHVTLGLAYSSRRRKNLEVVNSVVVSLDRDRERARRAVRPTCAYLVAWLSDEKAQSNQISLEAKKKISEFIRIGDERSAAKLVDNKMIELLTATGDLSDCAERCREYISQDVDQLAFCEPFGPKPKESISMLASKVIPKL